jgi:hypothetical protein
MATGRTVEKWTRVYLDGWDLSSQAMNIGPLTWQFDEVEITSLADGTKGYLPGQPSVHPGTLNGVFDNTATTGLHIIASGAAGAGAPHNLMVPIGIRGEPAFTDPCWFSYNEVLEYGEVLDGGAATVTMPFSQNAGDAATPAWFKPWGYLLHAKGAETAVNSAVGADNLGNSTGYIMAWQLFTSDGTVTLKIQHADTNSDGSFADLTGATSGSIDASTTPTAGMVVLGTAAVKRYLRWQLAFGSASTATFALAYGKS